MTPLCQNRGQEKAGLIQKHRADAHDEIASVAIAAGEMPANNIVSDGKKSLVGAFRKFDSRFFADPRHPLMSGHGPPAHPYT
jgi:hypothetical protein